MTKSGDAVCGLRESHDTQEVSDRCEDLPFQQVLPINPEEHLGLAHVCARRFRGRGMDDDELVREATVALVAAAARFDPSRGVRFSTYAVPCVLHDLKRACERAAPMHVPRTDRALLRQAAALRREELTRTGQEPTVDELAQTLGLSAAELSAALTADFHMQTIRAPQDERQEATAETAIDVSADRFVDELLLKDVIARLPSPLSQLAYLRFWEGETQAHTAAVMQLSQAQISKLERRAKDALREALAET